MEYSPVELINEITVERMVTVHYFQFARGYVFSGEKHEFWELVYMDKGAAQIGADGETFILNEGEVVFHKPGEFHTIWAGGSKAPDIIVISFVCTSQMLERFTGARMVVDEDSKRLMAQIISEARNAWVNKQSSDYLELVRRQDRPIGSEQMVKISLEALLIRLLRIMQSNMLLEHQQNSTPLLKPKTVQGRREYMEMLAVEIERYMQEHMEDDISIASLCRRFGMSGTSVKQLFSQSKGEGVIQYLSTVRHEGAKRLIREGHLNMTSIAERCGYGSVHYFSRRFTKMEGMTPTEYSRSVKRLSELPE
jgi:AraC-like DNA-binding protein